MYTTKLSSNNRYIIYRKNDRVIYIYYDIYNKSYSYNNISNDMINSGFAIEKIIK